MSATSSATPVVRNTSNRPTELCSLNQPSTSRGIFMGESRYDKYEELSVLRSFTRLDAAAKRRSRERELDDISRIQRKIEGFSNDDDGLSRITIGDGGGSEGRLRSSGDRGGGAMRRVLGKTLAFSALCAVAWLTSGAGSGAGTKLAANDGPKLESLSIGAAAAAMRSLKKNLATATLGNRGIDETDRKLWGDTDKGETRVLQETQMRLNRALAEASKNDVENRGRYPVRVLSLGGSTTWGSQLERRSDAYPYVLANELLFPGSAVTNIAVRATGSDYAGMCLQTMVTQTGPRGAPTVLTVQDGDTVVAGLGDFEYDVITVEYSLNGLEGLPLLLRRLRRRYPRAPIVYVHLWSLRAKVVDLRTNLSPHMRLGEPGVSADKATSRMMQDLADPAAKWAWDPTSGDLKKLSEAEALMANGLKGDEDNLFDSGLYEVYKLPMPEEPRTAFDEEWFGPDFHHLSAAGHKIVARGLADVIDSLMHRLQDRKKVVRDAGKSLVVKGSWGFKDDDKASGDQCLSWYETGVLLEEVTTKGGMLKMFAKPDKYALHVAKGELSGALTVEFNNRFDRPMDLGLTTMVWREGVYPKSRVTITPISPGGERGSNVQKYIFDPLHPSESFRLWHVTHTFFGDIQAMPGRNSLTIEPLEETEWPLRVTGLVMCATCSEDDDETPSEGKGFDHHQELRGGSVSAAGRK